MNNYIVQIFENSTWRNVSEHGPESIKAEEKFKNLIACYGGTFRIIVQSVYMEQKK
jgi:hypothetical protein